MDCAFTEDHYREIIQALLAAGYHFTSYADFVPTGACQVILRHDVDLSLEDAVRMARIEADLGVTSVFHVLLTAKVYNPMSADGQAILHEIRKLGHRIGLHVDPLAVEAAQTSLSSFHQKLSDLFNLAYLVLGCIDSYSVHRPATNGKLDDLQPVKLPFSVPPYSYADEYLTQILYRSDSRREWRYGCICNHIPTLEGRSLQLVIHPVWWTLDPCIRDEVLHQYLLRQEQVADRYLHNNLSFYRGKSLDG